MEDDPDEDGLKTVFELGANKDVPLHQYGASPFAKDIFVEIDYMTGAVNQPLKEYKMSDGAMSIAISTMAQKGINLHLFQDQGVPFKKCLSQLTPGMDWRKDFDEPYKNKYFTPARKSFFRYCLWACEYDCPEESSGLARGVGSTDFFVSLGVWAANGQYTDSIMAGTFLHELGHTLGLQHGSVDDWPNKPNHVSIMNYLFQGSGIKKDGKDQFLFSELECDDLNSGRVNEQKGIKCAGVADSVYRVYFADIDKFANVNSPLDMNGDGKVDPSAQVKFGWDAFYDFKGGRNEYDRIVIPQGDIGKAPASSPARFTAIRALDRVLEKHGSRSAPSKSLLPLAKQAAVFKPQRELQHKDVAKLPAALKAFKGYIPAWYKSGALKRLQAIPPSLALRAEKPSSSVRFTPTIQKHTDSASVSKFNVPVYAAQGFDEQGKLSDKAKKDAPQKLMLKITKTLN